MSNGVGARIKSARKKLGLTQADVAEEIGVTPTAISRYENESRSPDYWTCCRLSSFLRIPLDALMSDEARSWLEAGFASKDDKYLKYIGENIESSRKAANYTQKQLAEALGVTEATVQQWENWDRVPPLDKILDISELFNVDVKWLLFDAQMLSDIISVMGETHADVDYLRQMQYYWQLCQIPNSRQLQQAQDRLTHASPGQDAEIAWTIADAASDFWGELLLEFPSSEDETTIEQVHNIKPLVLSFLALNKVGQEEAIKRVSELTEIARYTTKDGG